MELIVSITLVCLAIRSANPPVATTLKLVLSSSEIRITKPSTMAAVPYINPDLIESSVVRPMIFLGG